MGLLARSYEWAVICFAMGVEDVLKRINSDDVPKYIFCITKPYRTYLVNWIEILLRKNKITKREADTLADTIDKGLVKLSTEMANLGFVYGKSLQPKGDGLLFHTALAKVLI